MLEQLRRDLDFRRYANILISVDAADERFNYLCLRGIASALSGDVKYAQEAKLRLIEDLSSQDIDERVDFAALEILLGQPADAASVLETCISQVPNHSLALARLAICLSLQGRLDEACDLLARSLAFNQSRISVWLNLARLQFNLEKYEDADNTIRSALAVFISIQSEFQGEVRTSVERELMLLAFDIWVSNDQLVYADEWLEQRRQTYLHSCEGTLTDGEPVWANEWSYFVALYSKAMEKKDLLDDADVMLKEALTHLPSNVDLLSMRGSLSAKTGRHQQAFMLFEKVIRLAIERGVSDASLVGYYLQQASVCAHINSEKRLEIATKANCLAQSLQFNAQMPYSEVKSIQCDSACALAHAHLDAGEFETAESIFNQVLSESQEHVGAMRGMGKMFVQLGKIDKAVDFFERVKIIDSTAGILDLISVNHIPDDVDSLELLEQSHILRPSAGGNISAIFFKLASAWEKKGQFQRAFDLVQRANESAKKNIRYEPQYFRNRIARTRHAFCAALFEHRVNIGYRGDNASMPVFVVGMPRSGTTLVEQILAGHNEIFGAGEIGVMASLIAGLSRWERRIGSGRRYPDIVDDLTPMLVEEIAKSVLDELRELAAETKPNARFVIDKMPHNFEHIGLIKFLFPEAKIISVRRDPRDIAISNYFTDFAAKHGGMGFAYDLEWIGQQLADHNLLMHHWHQLFPGEILEVQYEDVVEDIEGMARKMLDYIGVDWEPQVLAFNELDRPVKTASVWQVRQPIYKSSKAKWERYKDYLGPLIKGTNAKITWEPIEMVTLPEPGWFTQGVEQYKADDLDGAEYTLKKLLHHIPEHAAAKAIVGLICLRKGHASDGVTLLEQALQRCPWNKHWREDLVQALTIVGDVNKAQSVRERRWPERRVRCSEEDVMGHEGKPMGLRGVDAQGATDDDAGCAQIQTSADLK